MKNTKLNNLIARGKRISVIMGMLLALNSCERTERQIAYMSTSERKDYENYDVTTQDNNEKEQNKKAHSTNVGLGVSILVLLSAWYIGKHRDDKQK